MHCPRCQDHALEPVAFDRRTRVDWCTRCGGAWYEEGELERALGIAEGVALAAEGSALRPGLTCPACRTPTAEVTWPADGGVRIDACSHCHGRWLDRGELEGLRRVIEGRGLAPMREVGPVDGQPVAIPLAEVAQAARGLQPRWIAAGAVLILVVYGGITAAIRFFDLFAALGDKGSGVGAVALSAAGLVAFPLGGLLVGRGSQGFTIWEPALAAVPAALAMGLTSGGHLGAAPTAGLVLAGFVLALVGARLGEQLSGR